MANLLGGIEAAPITAPKRAKKRKLSPSPDYDNARPDRSSSLVPYRERKTSTNFNYGASQSRPLVSSQSVQESQVDYHRQTGHECQILG